MPPPDPLPTRDVPPPHIVEAVERDALADAKAKTLRLERLTARLANARRLYTLPEFQAEVAGWRQDLDALRDALETRQLETSTAHLRGQVATLRQFLDMPAALAREISALEAELTAVQRPEQDRTETPRS